jgi:tripartite-type tricarboxylate transporter receptor subunit TctC
MLNATSVSCDNAASVSAPMKGLLAAIVLAVACMAGQALAQQYPTRPVRVVVPFAPGGATDVIARLVGQKLMDTWGQPIVIDNRGGATGAIGSELVARAPPDGYTILMGTASTHSVAPAVNPKLNYKLEDYAPASLVATFPNMLVVHPSVPAKTVPEFIAVLKANPGKYNYASSGPGSSIHLAAELFKQMTGTEMAHVPYKGSGPAMIDLVAGRVQCMFDNMTTVWPYVQSGKLRALGVAGRERSPTAPDVPAIAETLRGYEANSWVGFFAPGGTPRAIVEKISADTRNAVHAREVAQKLLELGAVPAGGTPEEFTRFVKEDLQRWREVAKRARITLQ